MNSNVMMQFTDKQTLIEMAISQIKNDLNQGDLRFPWQKTL